MHFGSQTPFQYFSGTCIKASGDIVQIGSSLVIRSGSILLAHKSRPLTSTHFAFTYPPLLSSPHSFHTLIHFAHTLPLPPSLLGHTLILHFSLDEFIKSFPFHQIVNPS